MGPSGPALFYYLNGPGADTSAGLVRVASPNASKNDLLTLDMTDPTFDAVDIDLLAEPRLPHPHAYAVGGGRAEQPR